MRALRYLVLALAMLSTTTVAFAQETAPAVSLAQLGELYVKSGHVIPDGYLDQRVTVSAVVAEAAKRVGDEILVTLSDAADQVQGHATIDRLSATKAKSLHQGQVFSAVCTVEFSTDGPIALGDCDL
jgi:tRNA_anti-like